MKVCIVADVLGETNNGTTLACLNLINKLKSEGHEVKVLCPDKTKKGQDGYYVVPTLYLPFLMKKLERNNVSLSKPDKKIVEAALDGDSAKPIAIEADAPGAGRFFRVTRAE